ncbi:hypothetical protein REB14_21380 [Chryseobacterium sp. ES2]|uniref:DUF4293 family protein n=1 Tax=Chryseobacterium metallicongregator TaxID=3073042 RepID=A0ABU1EAH9_9FLAO|nr:hypothetical protein [Chryseobacterium sp. ES2]MDR4954741.1 hypothetical protein [Chryseobacterium sp. ES2]
MKNRIFKYRVVGIVVFLFELFLLFLFGVGTYDSSMELGIKSVFSIETLIFIFSVSIFVSTFLSLILLLLKSKKTILYLNINYTLIILFFVLGYFKLWIEKSLEEDDNLKIFLTFSIISIVLFISNIFRNKKVQFLEMEDIGKSND